MKMFNVKLTFAPHIDWYAPGRLNPNEYFDLWIYLIAYAVLI